MKLNVMMMVFLITEFNELSFYSRRGYEEEILQQLYADNFLEVKELFDEGGGK